MELGDAGPDRNLSTATLFDGVGDRNAVGIVAEANQREQDEKLEPAEELARRHLLNNTE